VRSDERRTDPKNKKMKKMERSYDIAAHFKRARRGLKYRRRAFLSGGEKHMGTNPDMAAVQAFRRSYYLVARGNNRNNGTSLGAVTLNANNALGNSNGNNWRSRLHIAPRAIYFLLNFCPRRKTAAWTAPQPETPHRAAGRARKRMRGERRPMRGGSAERPRFLARLVGGAATLRVERRSAHEVIKEGRMA
jgi:hypothetical protein